MAHFAKLDGGNIVETVEVVHNDIATTEQAGVDFLNNLYKTSDVWKQTSYNTSGGTHSLGGTPLRGNYAGVGMYYDEDNNIFRRKQPYASWTLNTTTAKWEPPTPNPDDGLVYDWNESTKAWDPVIV